MLSDGHDAPPGEPFDLPMGGADGPVRGDAQGLVPGNATAPGDDPIASAAPDLAWMPPLAPSMLQGQAQAQAAVPLASMGGDPLPSPSQGAASSQSQSQSSTLASASVSTPTFSAPEVRADAPVELEVIHETTYRYRSPVELAHHIAVLRPRDDAVQQLLSFDLHIDPPPSRQRSELDLYGNARTLFSLTSAHEALCVRACSRVRVLPAAATRPAPAWEACRAAWRYESGQAFDPATEFVFPSPMIPNSRALREWAQPSFKPGRALDAAAIDLMHRLHEEFRYEPLSTHVDTPLMEAFEQRRGVCQDFAHIMIGALRSLGLAARYVSGYLLTEPPPGQPRLQGADASHAWVAVAWPAVDRAGRLDAAQPTVWLELDPTNDCLAGTGHVRLAYGRDYADVTPLRGVIRGGGRHRLGVSVSTRIV